jgi:mercuric ion transport protein
MLKALFDPASAGGGLLAAIGAGACCAIPNALFVAGAAGAGSAWFDAFGWLGVYRSYLLGFAVAAVAIGAFLQWRSWRTECAVNGACSQPLMRRATFWLRGLALIMIGGVLVYG